MTDGELAELVELLFEHDKGADDCEHTAHREDCSHHGDIRHQVQLLAIRDRALMIDALTRMARRRLEETRATYTIEDVAEIIEWARERLIFDVRGGG